MLAVVVREKDGDDGTRDHLINHWNAEFQKIPPKNLNLRKDFGDILYVFDYLRFNSAAHLDSSPSSLWFPV
jgi:hypothetical protein